MFRRRVGRLLTPVALVALLLTSTASPAFAASVNGNVTCSGGKTVNISSRASVNVTHYWTGPNSQYWYNPYRELRVAWTTYGSTWYVVEYDFEIQSYSGYCVQ